jgi:glycerol kinase
VAGAPLILALDQGTTSSRALAFDASGRVVASAQQDFEQIFPDDGWVEHRPDDIWSTILQTARTVMSDVATAGLGEIVSIGITNQRETVLIWDRRTGRAIGPALVWQDRRTAALCRTLEADGHEALIRERTGLLIDPYFSATKIAWLLDHVDGARAAAEAGHLAFGTVDSFLIWKLTGGRAHLTDETNASRTSLFNIHTGQWDPDLLELFRVPASLLPEVRPSRADFGQTDPVLFGRALPIQAAAGDQQAAAFGQGCVDAGMAKSTYGTGCFLLVNTGETARPSAHRLLTTRACRTGDAPVFALEGSIFIAGAVAQWLRDRVGLVGASSDTEALAAGLPDNGGVYLVPAFTGLGAPHWDSGARGGIYGLTRQSGRAELVRAALESVAYQTEDLFAALRADGVALDRIRVDGGMAANSWLMQFISDIAGLPLERPANLETTALGAALLAGLEVGVWSDLDAVRNLAGPYAGFAPDMEDAHRQALLREWDIAVRTTRYRASLQAEA